MNEMSVNDEGVMDSILQRVKNEECQEIIEPNLLKDVVYQLQRSNKIKERILKNVRFFFWLTITGIFLSLVLFFKEQL